MARTERYKGYSATKKRNDKARYERRKRLLDSFKDVPCSDCGVWYPPYVMDFDHRRGDKKFELNSGWSFSIEALMTEVAKCDVVCANCHRERTHG